MRKIIKYSVYIVLIVFIISGIIAAYVGALDFAFTKLLELLVAKNSFFLEQRAHSGKSEWTSADFTTFLYLHTLNTYIPLLNHNNTVLLYQTLIICTA